MANALQSSGLVELNDTEQLGVTDHGKRQAQQYADREKQLAKDSRNYFKTGPLAIVRLFHR
jgi:Mn-dependent DtxR family transcriptional regulator